MRCARLTIALVLAATTMVAGGSHAADTPRSSGDTVAFDRPLRMPIDGIAGSTLHDTYDATRATGAHEALDIAAPRGTPVHAVDDGRIAKLFRSVQGGLTVYQFDPGTRFAYYYAHLDRYAENLREGALVRAGDVLGYVGTTGNAPPDAPHLHFAIFRLGPERAWWRGTPINPYPILRDAAR
jgi:murein DD-endopeptidase MepM/ murein hydrolase activator NlpD